MATTNTDQTNQPQQQTMNGTPSSAAGAQGSGTIQGSSPGYQTVDQAYNQLVSQNSPMMQQAAATAQRQAARRGLGNSSMASGMAQAAQATVAIPLAQQMATQSQGQAQYDRSQTEVERAAQAGEGLQQQQITNQDKQAAASLAEQTRAALANEGLSQQEIDEKVRSAMAQEGFSQQTIDETIRSNKAGEALQQGSLAETIRSNQVKESQGQQQITNQASQFAQTINEQIRSNQVSEGQAQQQINNQASQFAQSLAEQVRNNTITQQQAQQQINNQASQFNSSLLQQQFEFQANLGLENAKLRQDSEQFAQSIQANARGSYTDAVNNLLNNSSVNINNISSNANIPKADKDKLIAQELSNRNNDLQYLQSLYGNVTSWSDRL